MIYRAAPWKLCPAKFIVQLPEGRKEDHMPTELRAIALLDIEGLISNNPETIAAYTDGSVDPVTDRAGSCIVLYQNRTRVCTQAFRVPDGSSTLETDLFAILMALETA